MKRTYQLIIVAIIFLLILWLPSVVEASTLTWKDESQGIEWQYELDGNNNVINLNCTNKLSVAGKVTIPSTIDGKKVVSLLGTKYPSSSGASYDAIFKNCAGLTEIVIPSSISQISGGAFYNCVGLKTVTMPDNINLIEQYAFSGCTGITNITFSKELKSIQDYAFENCSGIKTLNLPNKLISIGESAFEGCTGIKKLELPNSITTIGREAFSGCSGITQLTISNQLTKIDMETFYNCSGLTSVIIPESVTTISSGDLIYRGAFANCKNLERILIPNSVATISEGAFKDCPKLTIYGNDGMESKRFAEENNIKFDYIANWDKKANGGDVTSPVVEKIEISSNSIKNCQRDDNTKSYVAPTGTKLVINVKFSENILGKTTPNLTIKFGSGKEIELTNGVLGVSTISYAYTIKAEDKGTINAVNLKGGDIKDAAGNAAVLSTPTVKLENYSGYSLYANGNFSGNATDNKNDQKQDDAKNDNSNKNNSGNNNTNKDNTNKNNNQKDNTTATGKIPQTGMNYTIISVIAIIVVISIVIYRKYTKYKDIK